MATRHEQGGVTTPVDVDVLREEIRRTYTDVSTDHDAEFIFPTGRWWAQELGYPSRSSAGCLTARSRASQVSPTTGRSAASNRARSCSISSS